MTTSTITLRRFAGVTSANDVGEPGSTSAPNADLVSAFSGGTSTMRNDTGFREQMCSGKASDLGVIRGAAR